VGLTEEYGLDVGRFADLVILDGHVVADALLDLPPRSWVLKRGRITVVSRHETCICRSCGMKRFRSEDGASNAANETVEPTQGDIREKAAL